MAAVEMQAAGPALPALTTAAEAGSSRHQAAELPEGFWYAVKRRALGPPLVTEQLKNQRLSRPLALGVLSCDGLSSAAYGTAGGVYTALVVVLFAVVKFTEGAWLIVIIFPVLVVHADPFSLDSARAHRLSGRWLAAGIKIPLELADCPDRRLGHAAAGLAAAAHASRAWSPAARSGCAAWSASAVTAVPR